MEEKRSDEDILRDVTESIAWDSRINDDSLNIVVNDGKVFLSGQVASYAEKLLASDDAWRVKGVQQIENSILVIPGEIRRDEDIAFQLGALLRNDVRVSHEDVKAAVSGGVVYLEGVVRGAHQRLAAEEDAWFTTGVIDVINAIEVRPDHKRTDEEIVQDVRDTLNRDVTIADPTGIEVFCHDGVVTLRGHVQSPEERRIAQDEAGFVPGVKQVVNQLAAQKAA